MTANLAVIHTQAIEPQSMPELRQLAKSVSDAGLGSKLTESQALIIMMTGRDLGLSYAQSMRAFHIVSGKPVLSADAMVAVCLRSDQCEYFRTVESSEKACTVEAKRRGSEPSRLTFSIEEAKRAGLLSNANWSKYPAQMLRARAKSALARDLFPDILLGLYDPDELEQTPAPAQHVEVEATIEEDPEQLTDTLSAGLLACTSVEAIVTYWQQEVFPNKRAVKAAGWGRLSHVAKLRKEQLEAANASPVEVEVNAENEENK